ncbi:unnamed protein product [Toxocara canis]|uniref:Vacuolar protein sorting-associated protein 13B n=1 Tax=Toxocara canis TaxID=6265 RepID=A0A183V7B4_TOXCA|nr:unnamed protein product [Toxocara canis]
MLLPYIFGVLDLLLSDRRSWRTLSLHQIISARNAVTVPYDIVTLDNVSEPQVTSIQDILKVCTVAEGELPVHLKSTGLKNLFGIMFFRDSEVNIKAAKPSQPSPAKAAEQQNQPKKDEPMNVVS